MLKQIGIFVFALLSLATAVRAQESVQDSTTWEIRVVEGYYNADERNTFFYVWLRGICPQDTLRLGDYYGYHAGADGEAKLCTPEVEIGEYPSLGSVVEHFGLSKPSALTGLKFKSSARTAKDAWEILYLNSLNYRRYPLSQGVILSEVAYRIAVFSPWSVQMFLRASVDRVSRETYLRNGPASLDDARFSAWIDTLAVRVGEILAMRQDHNPTPVLQAGGYWGERKLLIAYKHRDPYRWPDVPKGQLPRFLLKFSVQDPFISVAQF